MCARVRVAAGLCWVVASGVEVWAVDLELGAYVKIEDVRPSVRRGSWYFLCLVVWTWGGGTRRERVPVSRCSSVLARLGHVGASTLGSLQHSVHA